MWWVLTSCYSSGSLEFGYNPGRDCLCDQVPVKNKTKQKPTLIKSLMSFVGWQHFTHVAWGVKCILFDSNGQGLYKLEAGLPQTLSYVPLPSADCA